MNEAKILFDRRPTGVEAGLDVDGTALLQLRKACRLIETARHLEEEDRYYTVVVETSFGAIERTLQFYLLENDFLRPDEYVDHRTVYERSLEAGLYGEEFGEKLLELWRNNRSRSYYREGAATEARAEKMLELATAVHRHVLRMTGESHECTCNVV